MNKGLESKVPFIVENITRCMCPGCPVQTGSQCVNEKLGKLDEVMKNVSEGKAPKPEDVPGVYCSSGIAMCSDLDPSQVCICGSCAVWRDHNLVNGKPVYYFCQNGKAQ
ncbi:hypothetical protein ANME2D_02146 [Candidatus Methanoperedens nitroreducens]|uniref:DUF2769 domain-containing protein n=1 Tax=Candidatus Methanoperedens nitratireducens TaxID=1392998 RepID=A0A062UWQ1_9EURY|nr:DUF2769 domain-containing protein [Candidatus Methanoperedens nitroreducens]KCZ71416.1 hypothetical protein ANME2D_02146 [Candidatus Methanoperedens nitroreducens]MDJ1421042.1 DUF2769 domain-containing protein [Candidatus Methanoperedens sp.]